MRKTVSLAIGDTARALLEVAGEEASQQARLLVARAVGKEPAALAACRNELLTSKQERSLSDMLGRRLRAEPVQYILGEWEFMGLPFLVRSGALIPRQDTETLCERALWLAKEKQYQTALDLCCGSGCIGITLAKIGGLCVTAADCEQACIALTSENARHNGVELEVVQGDLFAPVRDRKFDLIVCNPPYLSDMDMRELQPELRYEPAAALYGGPDGLAFYRTIAVAYRTYLAPGGALLLEVGIGQAQAVASMLNGTCDIYEDINGIQRVVCTYA